MKKHILPITLVLLAILLSFSQPVLAQSPVNGLQFAISVGFDGYAKNNTWTPVRIVAGNTGPAVEGEIRLQTSYPGETYARSLSLPSQSQKEVIIFIPWRGNEINISFVSDDQVLYQTRYGARFVSADNVLVGVLASSPSALNFLAGLQNVYGDPLSVAHMTVADLHPETQGLSSLDVLIFNDIDTSMLTPAQQAALVDWVVAGGHLIVAGGPNGAATASGLSHLLPVTGLSQQTLSDLPALEGYANESILAQGPYLVTVGNASGDQVAIQQADNPLLVARPLGEGKVTHFALDFSLAPMRGWAGNDAFWQNLLDPVQSKIPFYATSEATRSINNALANISVAALPEPGLLFAFLCIYIIILVPINYLVLKRLKRRDWAWLTIPVLIVLFSLVGYIGGFRARGGRALLRQISVVQQTDGGAATVDTFAGLYSPNRDRYGLKFQDGFLVQPTDGGSGFEGIRNSGSAPTTIHHGSPTELQNLWTNVGSMSTLVAHGQTEPQPIALALDISPRGNAWQVSGVIQNNSSQPLEGAIVLFGDHGLELNTIAPGQTPIDSLLQPLSVNGSYGDQTIWGDLYYQLNDPQAASNDQIIRSIFWSSTQINLAFRQPTSPISTPPTPTEVVLLGWQDMGPAAANIEVIGRRVDHEAQTLIIIRNGL